MDWFRVKLESGTPITTNHLLAFLDDHPWKHHISDLDNTELHTYEFGPLDVKFNEEGDNIVHMICKRPDLTPTILECLHLKFSERYGHAFMDKVIYKTCFVVYQDDS